MASRALVLGGGGPVGIAWESGLLMGLAEAGVDLSNADTVIVDLRDPRELEIEGRIPGSFHCPRGMLEFWIDPESPYFKPVFGEGRRTSSIVHRAGGRRWRSRPRRIWG